MILDYPVFFADKLRLLKRMSFRKAINFLGIHLGFFLSGITRKAVVLAHPFSISTETAAICNLKCPECITGIGKTKRDNPLMDMRVFRQIMSQHSTHAFYANLYFQGEPFLNPGIADMIRYSNGWGYYTCISTNGHFLEDDYRCREIITAGLDRIIISLDGLSQESYTFYRRGGRFHKVISGIRKLRALRDELRVQNPLMEVQFLVNRRNMSEIPALKAFCKDLGADVVSLKTMQVYNNEGSADFLPEQKKYNRYKKIRSKNKPCYRLWSHAVYTSDAMAVPCCYDKLPEFTMGMALNKKPGELWFSPGMNNFRQRVIEKGNSLGICTNCDA